MSIPAPEGTPLNFVPKMDAARLIEGYKSIMRSIYSPGEYYQRALNCLERVVRTENSILAMKSPFSDDASPISSSN